MNKLVTTTVNISFSTLFLFTCSSVVLAHPGNTASDGCHYCRTNCDKWGVPWNERHCHGGVVSAPNPSTPRPTQRPTTRPTIKPTARPKASITPRPTTSPTQEPVIEQEKFVATPIPTPIPSTQKPKWNLFKWLFGGN